MGEPDYPPIPLEAWREGFIAGYRLGRHGVKSPLVQTPTLSEAAMVTIAVFVALGFFFGWGQ